jgi:hypothetical protein
MLLAAAKYITKYTHKGVNHATVEIQCRNEVSDLRDCWYIGASEASWQIFEYGTGAYNVNQLLHSKQG